MSLLEGERDKVKRQLERLCTAMWLEQNDAQRHGMKLLYIELTAKYETLKEMIKFKSERKEQCEHNNQHQ